MRGMNRRRLLLSATALSTVAMSVSVANAADIAAAPVVAAVPYYNWTGFYIGGHFGGGWGRDGFTETACGGTAGFVCGPNHVKGALDDTTVGLAGSIGDVGSHQFSGALGGVQAGYNWQIGRFLVGVEGQFSWSDMKGDHQNTTSSTFVTAESSPPLFSQLFEGTNSDRFYSNVKNVGTIAARLGLVSGPEGRTLFYAKGGAGYAKTDFTLAQQFSAGRFAAPNFAPPAGPSSAASLNGAGAFTGSATRWGAMAGAGLEFALFGGWIAKVEYDHLFLGTKSVDLTGSQTSILQSRGPETIITTGTAGGTRTFSVQQDINIVKFGLNYRFGNWYAQM